MNPQQSLLCLLHVGGLRATLTLRAKHARAGHAIHDDHDLHIAIIDVVENAGVVPEREGDLHLDHVARDAHHLCIDFRPVEMVITKGKPETEAVDRGLVRSRLWAYPCAEGNSFQKAKRDNG